jgi:hypothetical protein
MFGTILSIADDARKEAEKMVAKKKALASRSRSSSIHSDDAPSDDSTTSSRVSTSFSTRSPRPVCEHSNLWMIKRNFSLRAESVKTIEEEVVAVRKRIAALRERCVHTAKVAVMRKANGNERGTQMSLKKLRSHVKELEEQESRCRRLESSRNLIQTHSCAPEQFVTFLNRVMQEKDRPLVSDVTTTTFPKSETDLERHLRKGTLVSLFSVVTERIII